MTEKEIHKYIVRLNNLKPVKTIFKRKISPTVEIAKVWKNRPKRSDKIQTDFRPYFFFFIKNERQEYIGAVYDMEDNLHWYVLPKYRKKGYLTKALKEAIIPYIFDYRREDSKIQISISASESSYSDSVNVAKSLNFKQVDQCGLTFELHENDFDFSNSKLIVENQKMSKDHMEELVKNFQFHYRSLLMISNELEMTFDYETLSEHLSNIKYCSCHIDDLYNNQLN